MQEFLSQIDQQMPPGIILFFGLFALGIALFHTVILTALFKAKIKPEWLLFAVYPALLIILGFIRPAYAVVLFVFLVASTFLMAIVGMIGGIAFSFGKTLREAIAKKDSKHPLWLRIVFVIASLIFAGLFFISGPFAILLIFLTIIIGSILFPGNRSRFLKLQATLPTSKIGSMAMGLVEVEGTPEIITPMESPIKKKKCIGYRYTIEDVSSDRDGHKSYHTVHDETRCQRFFIKDETGKIEVNPDKLELINFDADEQYSNGRRRYTQYLISEGSEMLLIGKGNEEAGKPVIAHEEIYNVFAIAPAAGISLWNKFKPLRNQLLVYGCFVAFLIAVILAAPIEIKDGMVVISLGPEIFSLNF